MSTTSDYKFYNMSRIGGDSCYESTYVQNVEAGSYMLKIIFQLTHYA